jgi:N-acetylneuraminate synthase
MRAFSVGDRQVGGESSPYIIAEAGSNHEGSLENAKTLVDVASAAGADAVKFQTYQSDEMYGGGVTDDITNELRDFFSGIEMPDQWIANLAQYCKDSNVSFMSTPFDRDSAEKLAAHVPAFKVASTSISNPLLMERLACMEKPLFVSTGAHSEAEIQRAVTLLKENEVDFALLHCVSSYPTEIEDINVRAVSNLSSRFDVPAGLSDHTEDPVVAPCVAVGLDAVVIEKHITFDNSREGYEHEMAVGPEEFDRLVSAVRNASMARGSGEISVQQVEEDAHRGGRRSIYAARDLVAGESIDEEDITLIRPGGRDRGLNPWEYDRVIGSKTETDVSKYDPITVDVIK